MNRKMGEETRWSRFFASIGTGALFFCFSSAYGAVSSCDTSGGGDPGTPITTCYFDLTAAPSSTGAAPSTVLNGGLFRVPAPDSDLGQGFIVGTGVFQPFVRIQEQGNGNKASDGIEEGFNTDGRRGVGPDFRELDNHDKGGSNWNHSIKLSDIPKITVDGVQYYEFLLDVNEQGNSTNAGISLDEFKVFVAGVGNLYKNSVSDGTGSAGCAADTTNGGSFALCGAVEKYDMDNIPGGDASILMDYRNYSGSGNGVDLQALVPVANFIGVATDSFVYLYSKFGAASDTCIAKGNQPSTCKTPSGTLSGTAATLNYQIDAGFEEWSIRKKTTGGGGPGGAPVPGSVFLLALGLFVLTGWRRLQRVRVGR